MTELHTDPAIEANTVVETHETPPDVDTLPEDVDSDLSPGDVVAVSLMRPDGRKAMFIAKVLFYLWHLCNSVLKKLFEAQALLGYGIHCISWPNRVGLILSCL